MPGNAIVPYIEKKKKKSLLSNLIGCREHSGEKKKKTWNFVHFKMF